MTPQSSETAPRPGICQESSSEDGAGSGLMLGPPSTCSPWQECSEGLGCPHPQPPKAGW